MKLLRHAICCCLPQRSRWYRAMTALGWCAYTCIMLDDVCTYAGLIQWCTTMAKQRVPECHQHAFPDTGDPKHMEDLEKLVLATNPDADEWKKSLLVHLDGEKAWIPQAWGERSAGARGSVLPLGLRL